MDWLAEQNEWLLSLEELIEGQGKEKTEALWQRLRNVMARKGVANNGVALNAPYCNTISVEDQPQYAGDLDMEQRLENIIRWNAQGMVQQAYDQNSTLGGHVASYAAAACMYEVGFNHFFKKGDLLLIQGHASPGIYARALLEGRISPYQVNKFRQELAGGVCSYPHPRRMKDFWQIPTVSMGLGSISAAYQGRFWKYLENRGLKPASDNKIWSFIGDGEIDEPEILGSMNLPTREGLDNIVYVVNCNLQRLDGPVRGNAKIISELERTFLGSGWDVLKVMWGSKWDAVFARDTESILLDRLNELIDGDYQRFSALKKEEYGEIRAKICQGANEAKLTELLAMYSDEELFELNRNRGGNDPVKVYAAYDYAVKSKKPVCILMHTTKGYGMREAAEGKNNAHQKKKLEKDERISSALHYNIPISEEQALKADFYIPSNDSEEIKYLHARRAALGGYIPERHETYSEIVLPANELLKRTWGGSGERQVSTTSVLANEILPALMRDKAIGKYVVPIIPDEAQTFGMQGLFHQFNIYNAKGQQYKAQGIVTDSVMYRESTKGQVLQEGINEAGALASFTAAGSAYSLHGVPIIPFYVFYSMFGFQRTGDSIWAAADMLCKGFLIGGTAGRTTLNGEGLQHEDGHSLLLSHTVPSVLSYDPSFGYEVGVIVLEGIRRMYVNNEKMIYYIMAYNEDHVMPAMPEGVEDGILKGMYRFSASTNKVKKGLKANLMGSGSIMQQVLAAAQLLENEGIATDIWSVTSYGELAREATATERWNMLHPEAKAKVPYITQLTEKEEGVFVAASDFMKALPHLISRWMPKHFMALGCDGFGLSETREALRDYYEISGRYIAHAAMVELMQQGKVTAKAVAAFAAKMGIDGEKVDSMLA
ncbi:MAG: pyruvate dehydrogenase (acetyl-transferring), homodimeric type [Bacteroidota bacterium]